MSIATVRKLRPSLRSKSPSIHFETELWDGGFEGVVGMDEVGRGSWAGPISVGAAIIPKDRRVYKIRDSKMLTESERESMFERVADWCEDWAVGHASPVECDELGMSDAQRLAAKRALERLRTHPDRVLLDGNWDFVGGATRIVRGDARCLSIAAASILAKVTRDRIMRDMASDYPWYNFDGNKGYPCPVQKAALHALGPSAIHRKSWVFMDFLPWNGVGRFRRPQDQGTLFD